MNAGGGKIIVASKDLFIGETFIKIAENLKIGTVLPLVTKGTALLEQITSEVPSLVIMDLFMSDLSGLTILDEIKRRGLKIKILCYSRHLNTVAAVKAVKCGAWGVIDLSSSFCDFENAILSVFSFKKYIPCVIENLLKDRDFEINFEKYKAMTVRQTQILQLSACGSSNEEISYFLKISSKTVEKHKKNLRDKLGLKSTFELCLFAVREGFIEFKEEGDVFKMFKYRS